MKTRLLIVGDTLAGYSGLGYVAANWAKLFIETGDYEVAYLSMSGQLMTKDNIFILDEKTQILKDNLTLFNMTSIENELVEFNNVIKQFSPHIVLTVQDPWRIECVAFSEHKASYFWIAYTTIEVPHYGDRIFNTSYVTQQEIKFIGKILRNADVVIPVTKMAYSALIDLKLKNVWEENIYNGLDISEACDSNITKKEIFQNTITDDTFIFLTMGVNSERKKLERNILAFSKFIDIVKNPEKYILYIHCNIHASLGGPDLQEIILESGKSKQIIGMSNNALIPRNKIYEFYKVSDCYLGLSGGEGFGYGYAEAFLHKKPVIYTKWGGHCEFANLGGIGVACRDYVYSSRMGAKWGLADLKDASLAMRDLAYDKERSDKLGNVGYGWVKENIDWDVVFKKLLNCIDKTFSKSTSIRFYGSKIRRII